MDQTVTETAADSILNYKTKMQRGLAEARERLPEFIAAGAEAATAQFDRYCVVCGTSFITALPSTVVCSAGCRRSFERDTFKWADGRLAGMVPKALKVLEETPPSPEYVYFIQATGTGLIKIGYSRDVTARLSDLQNMSPEPLELLLTINGDYELEGRLHAQFVEARRHGEWFEPTDDLLRLIERLGTAETDEGVSG